MALKILEDSIASGSSLVWDFEGIAMTRKIVVGGLRSMVAAGKRPAEILWTVAQGVTFAGKDPSAGSWAGGQLYPGSQHPYHPDFMVWTMQADAMAGNDKMQIMVRYRNVFSIQIKLDGTVIRETTSLDRDGKLIKVGFQNKNDVEENLPCFAEVEAYRPGAILSFERFEKLQTRDTYAIIGNNGCVNIAPWQGCKEFTWMLMDRKTHTSFLHDQQQGTVGKIPLYIPVQYTFQYYGWPRNGGANGGTVWSDWRRVALYKNWQLRQIHPQIDTTVGTNGSGGLQDGGTQGNGWKRVDIQNAIDFTQFNLPQAQW
jgi:hypothetical protein